MELSNLFNIILIVAYVITFVYQKHKISLLKERIELFSPDQIKKHLDLPAREFDLKIEKLKLETTSYINDVSKLSDTEKINKIAEMTNILSFICKHSDEQQRDEILSNLPLNKELITRQMAKF